MTPKPADLKQIFDAFSAKTGADLATMPVQDFFVIHGHGERIPEDEEATVGRLLEHLWRKLGENGKPASTALSNAVIDCDAAPFIPEEGWKIEEHQRGGEMEFDLARIALHLNPAQQYGTIWGDDLREKLRGQPVLNACVLDHLLANPRLIPEDWKQDDRGRTRFISFWGTIYRGSLDSLYVRNLYWDGGQWLSGYYWLDNHWSARNPAALLAG